MISMYFETFQDFVNSSQDFLITKRPTAVKYSLLLRLNRCTRRERNWYKFYVQNCFCLGNNYCTSIFVEFSHELCWRVKAMILFFIFNICVSVHHALQLWNKSNKMQQLCSILRNGFTLHVSGDNLTHHQEYICCIWPQVSWLT